MTGVRRRARCNQDNGEVSAGDQKAINDFAASLEQPRRRPRGAMPTKSGPSKVEYGSVAQLPGGAVTVIVLGRPAPQGSKGPLGNESNPRTKPWREAIKKVCEEGVPDGWVPLDGPLDVEFWFYFDPPASAQPGDLPCTKTTFDWDKLSRALGDGLTEGGIIQDDARIVDAVVRKRYVWPGEGEARALAVVTKHRSP